MSNLSTHAELELRSAGLLESKDEYNNAIGKAVLELIEKFSEQGHSGTSAGITIHLFKTLAMFEPLGPLTGEDHEWTEVSNGLYQNKRLSSVFKHEDGVCTYNEAVVKRCPNGTTCTGPLYPTREDAINDTNQIKVKIKNFPFTAKTFYIDVIEEEIEKDGWIMWVKDEKQLEELFNYYEKI